MFFGYEQVRVCAHVFLCMCRISRTSVQSPQSNVEMWRVWSRQWLGAWLDDSGSVVGDGEGLVDQTTSHGRHFLGLLCLGNRLSLPVLLLSTLLLLLQLCVKLGALLAAHLRVQDKVGDFSHRAVGFGGNERRLVENRRFLSSKFGIFLCLLRHLVKLQGGEDFKLGEGRGSRGKLLSLTHAQCMSSQKLMSLSPSLYDPAWYHTYSGTYFLSPLALMLLPSRLCVECWSPGLCHRLLADWRKNWTLKVWKWISLERLSLSRSRELCTYTVMATKNNSAALPQCTQLKVYTNWQMLCGVN